MKVERSKTVTLPVQGSRLAEISVCVKPCVCVKLQAPKSFHAVLENAGCVM